MLPYLLYNLLQIAVVLVFAPLISGVITRLKERLQSRRGPSIFQVYRDIYKLFSKDEVIPEGSSWIFRAAPYFAFVAPVFVAALIPVLTSYPLFFAFMADMVGAGFVLALAGFFVTIAAVDGRNPYGAMGASRTRMVSFLAEPVFMVVFFAIAFVAGSTIPYIVQQHWVGLQNFVTPTHILILVAFFMLILAETGRLPVDNPSGHFELAMVDESKFLEFSGPSLALLRWAGSMKQFVLLIILANVLTTPWGLAATTDPGTVVLAIPLVLLKVLCCAVVIVLVESTLAKLRLFRISEFLAAALSIAAVALMIQLFT